MSNTPVKPSQVEADVSEGEGLEGGEKGVVGQYVDFRVGEEGGGEIEF